MTKLIRSQFPLGLQATKTLSVAIFIAIFTFSFITTNAQGDPKAGKGLYKSNCASCHKLNEKMTGPALTGVVERWESGAKHNGIDGKVWLNRWIKNWQDPVGAGNPYAMKMKDYDPSAMNQFPTLTDAQIDDILAYIQNPPVDASAPVVKTDDKKTDEPMFPTWFLFVILGVLVAIIVALSAVSRNLQNMVSEKMGEAVETHVPFYNNSKWRIVGGLVATVILFLVLVNNATALGRQQGYQPEQPIKFSHKLHAGTHKIDCQYCHTSADKSKHSNIPSISTCMNCHKVVNKGPKYGTSEIAKIYKYADYNPDTKTYGNNPKPTEWIRIHNLPDHVYFNHSQHVKVGGVKCQSCHGPIEEMEEVYQYAPLSMGWCINCHRNTEVNFDGNKYYSIYQKYSKAKAEGKMKGVTVENIGGTECQKCHY